MGVSNIATPIFVCVQKSKVIPESCLHGLTDDQITILLVDTIQQMDSERLDMAKTIKDLEDHLLSKYNEVYDPFENK